MRREQELELKIVRMEREIAALRDENDALRLLATKDDGLHIPPEWRLTETERAVLAALAKRGTATKEQLLFAATRIDREQPQIGIIPVFIHRLRKKLRPFGIEIEMRRAQGYALPPACRARLMGGAP